MPHSMRNGLWRLLLVLALSCGTSGAWAQGGQVGPANAILCGTVTPSVFNTSSAFTLVSGQANKGIYLCGWSASTPSAANFQLTFTVSTPAPDCRANPISTAITPPHVLTSNAPVVDHMNFAFAQVPLVTPTASAGNLCLIQTGSAQVLDFMLYFSQF